MNAHHLDRGGPQYGGERNGRLPKARLEDNDDLDEDEPDIDDSDTDEDLDDDDEELENGVVV